MDREQERILWVIMASAFIFNLGPRSVRVAHFHVDPRRLNVQVWQQREGGGWETFHSFDPLIHSCFHSPFSASLKLPGIYSLIRPYWAFSRDCVGVLFYWHVPDSVRFVTPVRAGQPSAFLFFLFLFFFLHTFSLVTSGNSQLHPAPAWAEV